jgi:hypothetical protein
MIYQLHWQNVANPKETIFIAQSGWPASDALASFREIIDRRKDECPKGWTAMVCNEDDEHFVMAARTTTRSASPR